MRIALVGAVESTRVAYETIVEAGFEIALLVTLPADSARRHSDYVDLAPLAQTSGTPVHYTPDINRPETIESIRSSQADYIFVIGWSQICGDSFLSLGGGRVIGYHPAPLPRLRGRAVIPWTILLDEKITAGTLFWIDRGVDTGPILGQEFFHVEATESAATLYAKHMKALRSLLRVSISALSRGEVRREAQDERCASYAVRRTPEDGLIDWRLPARTIERLVRAVGRPYPGAFTTAGGSRVTIWRSSVMTPAQIVHALPGHVLSVEDSRAVVATGEGVLAIEEWEVEGGGAIRPQAVFGRVHG